MEAEICALAPSDWQIRSVEDVCKRVTSGGTPSRTRPDFYVDGSWPWVKTQELQDTWIDHTEEKITDEAVANSSAKVLPPNTILLAMYGATVGQLGILRSPMTCNQACCAMIVDSDKADFRYLYHHLRYSRTQLKSLATGAAQQNLSGALIKSLLYPFPPLAEQKAIAAVLGALDDKIELNRRMNATLEAMARALFQSWFVDFDPVRAKLDGRPPAALDPATAALFPEHLEDSPLGHIPKGWEVVSLEELASIRGGKQLPTEDCLPAGKFTVFGANGIMGYATESTHDGFVIAFGRVGAYCGSIHWSLDGAWINNNASAVVPLQWPAFVLQTMLNIDFDSMRTGSAQPFIPNSSLASAKVLRPSAEIAEAFARIVEPWRRQQADNDQESRTLATLRDTLLPKLLSGELSVAGLDFAAVAGNDSTVSKSSNRKEPKP